MKGRRARHRRETSAAPYVPLAADADPIYLSGPWGRPPPYRPPMADQRAALADLYGRIESALAPAAAACRACGRCCHFQPGGIVLFASALELDYLVAEKGPPAAEDSRGPSDPCATEGGPWRCPYQRGDLCGGREARPLGCRTYFCDPEARRQGERLYDDALREVRRMAQGQGAWWYGPARVYLATFSY